MTAWDERLAAWKADLDKYAHCKCSDCIFQRSAYEAAVASKDATR